jgi:signal transduction histidine kinase/CheY-like chemotaxis protein/HPt (histidine-containing phosphotransfer) domain-containing protein
MIDFQKILPQLIREPRVPVALLDEFKREVALSNSRRLKAVTWLLISSLVFYLFADYFTIKQTRTLSAHDMWLGIVIMRPFAMIACGIFIWQFGPLKSLEDVKPKHRWIWKAYIYFFLAYTAIIVGYMFPLKESIGPIYIFLLGPSAFIAMTTRQTTVLLTIGLTSIAGALYVFVPESTTIKFHLINAMIISWVSFVVAHVTYANTFRDFMNRKLIEEKNNQLEETRRSAEKANQAKSDFLAAISHEIRTPMNSILGMTEIALHTPLNNEQRDYIETARESALHLLDMINDILDFSRIEARKLRLINTHFDLPAVLHSTVKTVRLQAEQKGLKLELDIMDKTPRFIAGDPGRLRQILINLLNNAIKFTDKGYIRTTVGPCPRNVVDPDHPIGLLFSVKDTGPGIPKDKAKSIFEAFSQVDSSTSRTVGGSGLGLAICKDLVTAMKGDIWLESRPDKGCEFLFTARFEKGDPLQSTEVDLINATWNMQVPITPSRILLVDDNPTNLKVEKLHLDRMGMTTTLAESGPMALAALADNDYDLVLMDLEMPGMDGHETCRHIRNGEGLDRPVRQPDIPILAVTAHALSDVQLRCERTGMNGFVAKPVSFGELGAAMRQILGGDWPDSKDTSKPNQDSAPVLDLVYASTHLGVSKTEILHLLPNAMNEINLKMNLTERAVQTRTLREVAFQTHTLKSVAASIGAEATRRAALKLENAARREELDLSQERLIALRKENTRLKAAVAALSSI